MRLTRKPPRLRRALPRRGLVPADLEDEMEWSERELLPPPQGGQEEASNG